MAQLTRRGEAAMADIDDDRPLGVERGADVAPGLCSEARARLAAADQLALDQPRQAQRASRRSGRADHGEAVADGADRLHP